MNNLLNSVVQQYALERFCAEKNAITYFSRDFVRNFLQPGFVFFFSFLFLSILPDSGYSRRAV